ncbi:MAG: response regulator [Hyphomicrobiales bacterium]|nr:response regulator [Hyphomicrobiales bacterium]
MRRVDKAQRDAARTLRIITWSSVLLPVIVFAIAAYTAYHAHFEDARARGERASDVVREHANRTFDIPRLARFVVNDLFGDLTAAEIHAREAEFHQRLKRFAETFPQVEDIWVLDASGRALMAAYTYPAPRTLDLSDRGYFRVFKFGVVPPDATYVSEVLTGRHREGVFFQMAFARQTSSGEFDGVTAVSINPKYFRDFYNQIKRIGIDTIGLVREDGKVLARYPTEVAALPALARAEPFAREVQQNPDHGAYEGVSAVDGVTRLVSYRKVGEYPVYAAIGIDRETVLAAWRNQLAEWSLIGGPATAIILGLCLVAGHYTRKEAEALAIARMEIERREMAEEQNRQMLKMEAVGQLTGGIAHDFNNLLTIILGSLDLMRRRLAKGDANLGPLMDGATEGAKRAATLTAQLLAFARRQPLDPKPVNPNALVANMSVLLQRTLGEHIVVETHLAPNAWMTLIDINQLENAIINLAINARDAMPNGGALVIETANTYLDDAYASLHAEVASGEYVVIAVSDTGVGMSPEVAAKAFDPFFTTKEGGRGTGLGLSQVYGFVKQSKGHLKLYSELGHGTCVKLYLPRHMGDAPPATAPAAETAPLTGVETILLVEDEKGVRTFAKQALSDLGYSVLDASDAESALKLLENGDGVDLLLTDIVMPMMNGKELAVRALRRRPRLKVLYMTGYSRNAIIHNGVLDPGVELINKPFTIEQLAMRVRKVLDE